MLAGSHRNAWPDETGTGGRTNRNTHLPEVNSSQTKNQWEEICWVAAIGDIKSDTGFVRQVNDSTIKQR